MKKISLVLFAALLLSVGSAFSNVKIDDYPSKTLSEQIDKLLSDKMFKFKSGSEIFAVVYFTINTDNEIVVLTVATDDQALETYLKRRLNYAKVDVGTSCKVGGSYKIPVRIMDREY